MKVNRLHLKLKSLYERVKWWRENPQSSPKLNRIFSLDAPEGHLPGNIDWWVGINGGPPRFSYLIQKLSECRIGVAEQSNDPDRIPF